LFLACYFPSAVLHLRIEERPMSHANADQAAKAKIVSDLQKMVEVAYQNRFVSRVQNGDEVVFTIHVPHASKGPANELFRFAANLLP
jgi:hypothetical protein